MAMKINAGDVARGRDEFLIDPAEILVSNPSNGRYQQHTDEAIQQRAASFEKIGQQTPVLVRKIADDKVELVLGFLRRDAALYFNAQHPDNPMKLRCNVVKNLNDEDAFVLNVSENLERVDFSPIDHAYNQRRFRDVYNWTDTQIAEFYHVVPSYIGTLKKLLGLPKKVQRQVHAGTLSVKAAVALTELPAEEQEAVLQEVPQEEPDGPLLNGQAEPMRREPTSQEVIQKTRDRLIDKGKSKGRSLAEVRKFLEKLAAEENGVGEMAKVMLKYVQGKLKDDTATKNLWKILVPESV